MWYNPGGVATTATNYYQGRAEAEENYAHTLINMFKA